MFAGGKYLETELTITGSVSDPSGILVIDYTIEQEIKDKGNLLLRGNWILIDGCRGRWSMMVFIGSREAIITSLNWRFCQQFGDSANYCIGKQ